MNSVKSRHLQKVLNKKAQEEMVGFVIIMLVVAVIFVIFLGIYISGNSKSEGADSEEVSQFLSAALEYTTDCSSSASGYNPLNIRELLRKCQEGGFTCSSAGEPCEIFKSTLKNLTESAWKFGQNRTEKNYDYKIEYSSTGIKVPLPSPFGGGVAEQKSKGATKIIPASNGKISINLKIYI